MNNKLWPFLNDKLNQSCRLKNRYLIVNVSTSENILVHNLLPQNLLRSSQCGMFGTTTHHTYHNLPGDAAAVPCASREQNPPFLLARYIGASLKTASLHHYLGAMRDTNSSPLDLVGTSLETASLHLRAMSGTDSSLLGIVFASFEAATLSLLPCDMSDTYPSLLGWINSSLDIATFSSFNCDMG